MFHTKKEKRIFLMVKKNKQKVSFNFDFLDSADASSATECTGISPTPPLTDGEYKSYQEVVSFGPPKTKRKKNQK